MADNKRVLVVDDNPDAVRIISTWLGQRGFDVLTADSGDKALHKARVEPLDCIVLDIMMPGLDGLQVCQQLRSRPETKNLPIIILSVKKDPAAVESAREMKVADYLVKPVSPLKLMEAINLHARRNDPQKFTLPAQRVFFVGADADLISKTQDILDRQQTGAKDCLHIMPFSDYKQAAEMLSTEKPKAIIVDARPSTGELPSFCRHLKLNPDHKQVAVIVLLQNAADDIKFAWSNECLLDPVRPQRLADSLKRHIQRKPLV